MFYKIGDIVKSTEDYETFLQGRFTAIVIEKEKENCNHSDNLVKIKILDYKSLRSFVDKNDTFWISEHLIEFESFCKCQCIMTAKEITRRSLIEKIQCNELEIKNLQKKIDLINKETNQLQDTLILI